MDYHIYFMYNELLDVNVNDNCTGTLCGMLYGYIQYSGSETKNDELRVSKVGFVKLLYFNQVLAKEYGLTMTEVPLLKSKISSKALMELDATLISTETINEIGAASNPNIMLLENFGISADFRRKGLGEKILKGIIKQMKGRCGYLVILNPQSVLPNSVVEETYESQGVTLAGLEKDPEKAQWKLNEFFQRCGFRLFKNYNNVFVCNVDQLVASLRLSPAAKWVPYTPKKIQSPFSIKRTNYNLQLEYDAQDHLNIRDKVTEVWDKIRASIIYETNEAVEKPVGNSPERRRIGFINLFEYNQVLAMMYGVNINQVVKIADRSDSKPIMELDYSLISQETIDEIGLATNPNILVLEDFGISAAWRNKGIGEQVLKNLIKQMKGKYGYMIITESKPAQFLSFSEGLDYYKKYVELDGLEKDPEKAQLKLNAFFQRCGFRLFKDYPNVFICNIDQAGLI
jgi:predicted acetyltransferase